MLFFTFCLDLWMFSIYILLKVTILSLPEACQPNINKLNLHGCLELQINLKSQKIQCK